MVTATNIPHAAVIRKRLKKEKAHKEKTSLNYQLLLPLQIPSYNPTYRFTQMLQTGR